MSKALIAGINQVAADKNLDHEVIFSAIETALVSAYKRNFGPMANVTAEVDRTTGEMRIFAEKEVVEDVMNPNTEILLEEARKIEPDAQLGDVIRVPSTPDSFGRIAAQTAKQVILQRIREAERDTVYENFIHRVGEVINAQVRSVDFSSGAVTVLVGDKYESLLPREEQIPTERLRRGDYVRLYIVDVHKSNRGPVIKLSRTHRNLLRRLMEQEIPEVRDGTVEIKAIAREPGARSKVAVSATVPGVDPVGSCVGMRGLRIQNIVNELAGEKIDVVEWSSDLRTYIANALSPAKVEGVILDESNSVKTATVIVPDRQLSLAIGKEGQNARLAAKLTGWRIDIKSQSEAVAEGLDVLAAQQAQLAASGEDLLARVERFLRSEPAAPEFGEVGEDLLSQAAEALQKQDEKDRLADLEEGATPSWPEALPTDLIDELPTPDRQAALDAFERAAATISQEEVIPPFSEEALLNQEQVAEEAQAEIAAEPIPEEAEEADLMPAEELPTVITADMLRKRMAERKAQGGESLSLEDVEVPAELLVGLDEEEEEDEFALEERKRNKARRGKEPAKHPTRKAKAKRPRRRREEEDDEFGFDFD